MDKMPFFIRHYHAKEEDKNTLDKEVKRLCYLGILKEDVSAYSSPVNLISRKVTQNKRVVTDFRHLNMHIAKNNLAYPLLKETFTMLGSSSIKYYSTRSERCISVSQTYWKLVVHHIYIRGCLWDLTFPLQFGNHT